MYGKCIHCQCLEIRNVNGELRKVCTWGPPACAPIIVMARGPEGVVPQEIGQWTGRPILESEEGCFQSMPKGIIEGGKVS